MTRHYAEEETIILINRGDTMDGFFQFGTSNHDHYQRLLRRLSKLGLTPLQVKESKAQDGSTVWWQCHIPKEALSKVHFGLKGKLTSKH